jgi:serine protease
MENLVRCGLAAVMLLGALLGLVSPVSAAPSEAPAWGLIVGLRDLDGVQAREAGASNSPSAEQGRDMREERARSARIAQEAGLAVHSVGEAGRDALLRFAQPQQGQALQDAMRRVRLHPEVAWVEPNVLLRRLDTVPNDPAFSLQWALQTTSTGGAAALNLPPAWDLTQGNSGVAVAVLDSGILPHPDLVGRVLPGHDFVSEVAFAGDGNGRDADATDPGDWVTRTGNHPAVQQLVSAGLCGTFSGGAQLDPSSWHGTFIAGQIAARTNNGLGMAGVTWAGAVLPVRISGKCGAFLADLLDGMRWAAGLPVSGAPANAHPARVINLSFGGDVSCALNPAYQRTIDEVTARGALVVVAAGNTASQLTRPADCQRVLAVGAVRRDGLKTSYSSYGPTLSLMAPGGSTEARDANLLYSTSNSGLTTAVANEDFYDRKQGTSFAAPWASGAAALMLAQNPALSPAQLIDRLRTGSRPWPQPAGNQPVCNNSLASQGVCQCTALTCGSGLLDAVRSVQLAQGPAAVIQAPATVLVAGALVLDASASVAIDGSRIVAYQWAQLEGPGVVIEHAQAAVARVGRLPALGTYVFGLSVTDDQGRIGRDRVQVAVVAAEDSRSSGGGGSHGLWWGIGLWIWVLAMARSLARQAGRPAPPP